MIVLTGGVNTIILCSPYSKQV